MVASGWDGVQSLLGKIWVRLDAVDKLATGQESISKRLDRLEEKMTDFQQRLTKDPASFTQCASAAANAGAGAKAGAGAGITTASTPARSTESSQQVQKSQPKKVSPGEKVADTGMTYMLDRVNMVPMKISWAIYNKVKHLYGDGHIPEIAAKPGDDTLYVNIWDKVNECK